MKTTIKVRFDSDSLISNVQKNLPIDVKRTWAKELGTFVLADIKANRIYGPARYHLKSSAAVVICRLNTLPAVLHRVGVHPYGGPIDDLYDTPTLHEVLDLADIWITYGETEKKVEKKKAKARKPVVDAISPIERITTVLTSFTARPENTPLPAIIEGEWRSAFVKVATIDVTKGHFTGSRHTVEGSTGEKYAIEYIFNIPLDLCAEHLKTNGDGTLTANAMTLLTKQTKVFISWTVIESSENFTAHPDRDPTPVEEIKNHDDQITMLETEAFTLSPIIVSPTPSSVSAITVVESSSSPLLFAPHSPSKVTNLDPSLPKAMPGKIYELLAEGLNASKEESTVAPAPLLPPPGSSGRATPGSQASTFASKIAPGPGFLFSSFPTKTPVGVLDRTHAFSKHHKEVVLRSLPNVEFEYLQNTGRASAYGPGPATFRTQWSSESLIKTAEGMGSALRRFGSVLIPGL